MYKKIDLFYSFLHLPVDIVALILAFISAYWLRSDGNQIFRLPYGDFLHQLWIIIPIWILIYIFQGMYDRRHLFSSLQNTIPFALASLSGWAGFIVYLVFTQPDQTLVYPRLLLIYVLIFSFIYVFVGRLLLRFVRFLMRSLGIGRSRMMILGEGKVAEQLEKALQTQPDKSIQLIKRLPAVSTDQVLKDVKKYGIEEIVLADAKLGDNQILEYIVALQNQGVVLHLVPNMYEVQASNVVLGTLAGLPLVTFRQTPLEGWGRIVKRTVDVLVSLAALIVLSPLILLVMLIIKITSPGNIVFSQQRLGRNGQHFKIYKFRSMYSHLTGDHVKGKTEIEVFRDMGREDLVEEYKRDAKVQKDPRVTPFGRFMRKTRLDELPQIWNVLRGDLSLVGPRPIRDFELARYGRWASYLMSIKPGLTGLWQVSGSSNISYEERVKLDAQYVQNWSLWQDIIIMIKTIAVILGGGDGV